MRLKLLLCASCVVLAATAVQAEIFKSVDKDGNVTFSDKASAKAGSETSEVKLNHSNTVPAVETTIKLSPEASNAPQENQISYQGIVITTPINDSAIEHGPGNFSVGVRVVPALAAGHKVQVLLDGAPVGAPVSGYSVPVSNVDRGTHSLVAQIVDGNGRILKSSPSSTVHVFRPSVAFPGFSR